MADRIQNVKPTEWNGINFRSTFEAKTAEILSLMGIPFQYECRKIVLQEGFRSPFQSDKVRAVTYKPDFIIGNIMLECKGFETPEWKIKKKLVFKYLQDNEPDTIFYQIHDCRKQLLEVLDKHWNSLGFNIQVTSKPSKKNPSEIFTFNSIEEAMEALNLKGKAIGSIIKSLTGEKEYIYNYNWKLNKLN